MITLNFITIYYLGSMYITIYQLAHIRQFSKSLMLVSFWEPLGRQKFTAALCCMQMHFLNFILIDFHVCRH